MDDQAEDWRTAAISAANLSGAGLIVGRVAAAVMTAKQSVAYGEGSGGEVDMIGSRTADGEALDGAGQHEEAARLFEDAERREQERQSSITLCRAIGTATCCWTKENTRSRDIG